MRIHDVGLAFANHAFSGLDDVQHLVALRVKNSDRTAISLIYAGPAHERDEHVLPIVNAVPHDVFADLLALRIKTVNTVDDRASGRVTRQTDFGKAAPGIEARGVEATVGAVVEMVQRRIVTGELELLEDFAEVLCFRIQLHYGHAVAGSQGRQAPEQYDALGLFEVAVLSAGRLRTLRGLVFRRTGRQRQQYDSAAVAKTASGFVQHHVSPVSLATRPCRPCRCGPLPRSEAVPCRPSVDYIFSHAPRAMAFGHVRWLAWRPHGASSSTLRSSRDGLDTTRIRSRTGSLTKWCRRQDSNLHRLAPKGF